MTLPFAAGMFTFETLGRYWPLMVGALLGTGASAWVVRWLEERQETLRNRLIEVVFRKADNSVSVLEEHLETLVAEARDAGEESVDRDAVEEILAADAVPTESSGESGPSSGFVHLLIEYYSFGLTQARASFYVSLGSSIVGGLVLIAGVILGFTRSGGSDWTAALTSVSGLISSAIGALFHRQSAKALTHMEGQTDGLRVEMRADRDQVLAIQLLDGVGEEQLRAQLQAGLILKLTGAELPDLPGVRPGIGANNGLPEQAGAREGA